MPSCPSVVCALLLLAAPVAAQGGEQVEPSAPFGLEPGMSIEGLRALGAEPKPGQPSLFALRKAPRSHPDFAFFELMATADEGLCKLVAVTHPIHTNRMGTQLVRDYERLVRALGSRYGRHGEIDKLLPGSLWDEPHEFMKSLERQERRLVAAWLRPESEGLPDDIDTIAVVVHAVDSTTGLLILTYEFSNLGACRARVDAAESAVF